MTASIEELRHFDVFKYFTEHQINSVLESSKTVSLSKGKVVARKGFSDKQHMFFLLAGELLFDAEAGHNQYRVKAGGQRSKGSILSNEPSQYKISAISDVDILQVQLSVLEQNTLHHREEYEIYEPISESEVEESHILYDLIVRLNTQDYLLPSLPAVALQIRDKLQDSTADYKAVADVVMMDSAITTKIIKVANSVYYTRGNKVATVQMALSRIGLKTVMDMVCTFALKELFKSNDALINIRMYQLWEHSIDIAVMSYVIALHAEDFDAEHAMLAGLVHDIGVNAILALAQEYPDVTSSKKHLSQVVEHMRHETGVTILTKWEFEESLISVAANVQNWQYEHGEKLDYVDIVNMAHLVYRAHRSEKGKELMLSSPVYQKLPIDDETLQAHIDEASVMKSLLIG